MIRSPALLLSIKPRFAEAIYTGDKAYEFRRIAPRRAAGGPALIYETSPVGLVTGLAVVGEVIHLACEEAAGLAGGRDPFAGVYEHYLRGGTSPCAIALLRPCRLLTPARLAELTSAKRPPQSFGYVEVQLGELIARLPPGACRSSEAWSAAG